MKLISNDKIKRSKALRKSWLSGVFLCALFLPTLFACKDDALDSFFLPGAGARPLVVATNPVEGALGVSGADTPWVLFDRPMDIQKTQSAFRLSSAGGSATGQFYWEGTKMYYRLSTPLSGGDEYTMVIGAGSETGDGVDLGEDLNIRFYAIADLGAPAIVSVSPPNGAGDVDPNSNIEITFSEPIDFSTVDDGLSISPSVISTKSMDTAGTTLVINPTSALSNATYTVNLSRSVKDLAGNRLDSELSFSFTVGSDFTEPALNGVAAGALNLVEGVNTSGVSRNDSLVLTFSEAMNPVATEEAITISPSLSYQTAWNAAGDQLTLNFNPLPDGETSYNLTVGAGAADTSGNPLVKSYTFPYYTDGANSTRPEVLTVKQAITDITWIQGTPYTEGATQTSPATFRGPFADNDTLDLSYQYDYSSLANCCYGMLLRVEFNNQMVRNSFLSKISFDAILPSTFSELAVDFIEVRPGDPNAVYIAITGALSDPGVSYLYRLTIQGGAGGVTDNNGNTLESDYKLYLRL